MLDGDDLLTIAQVAALAQVSRRTVERRIDEGQLEAVKLSNRMVRIRGRSVKRWLAGDTNGREDAA
jgi:excisionase family DNA binding protein